MHSRHRPDIPIEEIAKDFAGGFHRLKNGSYWLDHLAYGEVQEIVDPMETKVITLLRDPRDQLVSSYCYFRHLSKTVNLSFGEYFIEGIRHTRKMYEDYFLSWSDYPFRHTVRYEELVEAPLTALSRLTDFLGSEIPEERLYRAISSNTFEQLSGNRKQGDELRSHHYRKGQPGDWANWFTLDHCYEYRRHLDELHVHTGYPLPECPRGQSAAGDTCSESRDSA